MVQRSTSFAFRMLAVTALGLAFGAAQAQYKARLINPIGATSSRAWAAYNGRQFGSAGSYPPRMACLWSGTSQSALPMTPTGWSVSFGFGIGGNQQVGAANSVGTGYAYHALMWLGSADNFVDLHPANYSTSAAYGSDGFQQTGQATTFDSIIHAVAWNGSAASVVDLHPAGYDESHSYNVWAGRQAGYAVTGGASHAMVWSSSAASAVDLNGALSFSQAQALDATRQAGFGAGALTGGATHALAWYGSASSVVDLNPAGYSESYAYGAGKGVIVGYGRNASLKVHALVWRGPNLAPLDLHPLLPAGYSASYAYGVDPITGDVVGEAINSLGRYVAFIWIAPRTLGNPVPIG